MKIFKLKTILYLCISIMLLSSCEDFLDKQEDEAMTLEKIWKLRSTTKQYWLNSMSFLPDDANGFIDSHPWLGASDEASCTYNRAYRKINFGTWNASNEPYYKMSHYYKGIRECNIFMQNVDKCSDPLAKPEELASWKVNSRWARAYYYFLMMRCYGPVFLLGDELLDFAANTSDLEQPRNTWEECVNYVVSEMEECAKSLPTNWEDQDSYGLPTKGACYAVISRLELYSARPLFNGNPLYKNILNPDGTALFPATKDPKKWVQAAKSAQRILDMNKYELYRDENNDPVQNYLGIISDEWNSEIIWSTGYKNRYIMGVHTAPTGLSGTAYGGVSPTQQQVDAYAMSNGKYPITGYDKDGNPIIDEESGYTEVGKSIFTNPVITNPTYASRNWPNMYKDREPRFYASVFWSDSYWEYKKSYTLISFAKGGNSNKSHDHPKPGYMIYRYYNHHLPSDTGQWGNVVFPTFRLGEIYLNYIESVLEAEKAGISDASIDHAKAIALWDELRDRSGMTSITETYPNADTNKLIALCRQERRIELAFENHRFFDTRTWMIAEQTDNGPMYGMNTETPSSGNITPEEFWKRTVFEKRVFKSNHYLYPFSQRELDRNKQLVQNYGW